MFWGALPINPVPKAPVVFYPDSRSWPLTTVQESRKRQYSRCALLASSATNKTVRDIGLQQISPLIQSGVQAFSQAPVVCHFGLKFIRFYLGCGFLLIASADSWRNVACEMNTVLVKAHRWSRRIPTPKQSARENVYWHFNLALRQSFNRKGALENVAVSL